MPITSYKLQFEDAAKKACRDFIKNREDYDIQLIYSGTHQPTLIRNISVVLLDRSYEQAKDVNTLVRVPGIVISASRSRAYARKIVYRCSRCHTIGDPIVVAPMRKATIPRECHRYYTLSISP